MTITVAGNYEYTSDSSDSISFEPQKTIGKGFCFDCDRPVAIEYDQWWIGDYVPPKICQECNGHDVEFVGRVAERLWERIGTLNRKSEPMFGANIRDAINIIKVYIEP